MSSNLIDTLSNYSHDELKNLVSGLFSVLESVLLKLEDFELIYGIAKEARDHAYNAEVNVYHLYLQLTKNSLETSVQTPSGGIPPIPGANFPPLPPPPSAPKQREENQIKPASLKQSMMEELKQILQKKKVE